MDTCARCAHADDTEEIGYYFRCDQDNDIHWKEESCDKFKERVGIIASYDDVVQEADLGEAGNC